MACSGPISSCFSKKTTELLKKAIVVLLIQIVGWFVYTYIEEGFPLTDCIFNHDNIKKIIAKKSNVNDTSAGIKLYFDISHILKGDLKPDKFEVYYDEFKNHFNVTPTVQTEVSIREICRKWYLFTAITLTTVGYGNVVPKTVAGKIFFFPYCLIGIPAMLFLLAYIGQLFSQLCITIVEMLSCCRRQNGQHDIKYKEFKSFAIMFLLLWLFIIFEALQSAYFPQSKTGQLRFLDGIYFYFVSFTTIGYGDITSPMDETMFEIRLYIGLSLMSGVVSSALEFYQKFSERRERAARNKKCCCFKQGHVAEFDQSAEERVVVQNHYFQKEFGMETFGNQRRPEYGQ